LTADEFTTADLVTLIIAAWGAVLATGLATWQLMRHRRRLRIVVLPAYDTSGPNGVVELWSVRVVNIRERPIEVRAVGLVLPGGIRQFGGQVGLYGSDAPSLLPALLGDGESVQVYFGLETGVEPDSIEGAFAQDTLGREYVAHYPGRSPRKRWRAWKAERAWRKQVEQRGRRTRY
jgi:hypothetical protein